MKTRDIIKQSIPAFVFTFQETKNALKLLSYVKFNKDWINEFDNIIFSTNGNKNVAEYFIDEFKQEYKCKPTLLHNEENMGHTFGTIDNDTRIIEYLNNNLINAEYLWKFSGDVIANKTILDIEIDDSCDFFYINNVGSSSLLNQTENELLNDIIAQKYFYPQTNYYIVKHKKIQSWYPDRDTLNKCKKIYDQSTTNSMAYPWDILSGEQAGLPEKEGLCCEAYLAKTILESNLKKQNLVSAEDTKKLLALIKEHNIGDGSHKNMLYTNIGGLCHYHITNGMAIPI